MLEFGRIIPTLDPSKSHRLDTVGRDFRIEVELIDVSDLHFIQELEQQQLVHQGNNYLLLMTR